MFDFTLMTDLPKDYVAASVRGCDCFDRSQCSNDYSQAASSKTGFPKMLCLLVKRKRVNVQILSCSWLMNKSRFIVQIQLKQKLTTCSTITFHVYQTYPEKKVRCNKKGSIANLLWTKSRLILFRFSQIVVLYYQGSRKINIATV